MNKVDFVTRKSMVITPSGRSSDFMSPSFGHGCLYNCTYCTLKRHKPTGLTIADKKSVTDILTEINSHAWFDTSVEKPNQTHEKYITYDISVSEDFALHSKYHDWKRIFKFFKEHELAMATFATKYVNYDFLEFNPENKVRIRFSLMPEELANILEPKTSPIIERMGAINSFIEAGYDVHVNFSPVIYTKDWLVKYAKLFEKLDGVVKPEHKSKVKAEVIFLTHNEKKHLYNVKHNLPGEDLLWLPDYQEEKVSNNGDTNLRYKRGFKAGLIQEFKNLHDNIIPWNTIRYIF